MMARIGAAVAAALLVAACGGGDEDGRYDAGVAEVRQAVEAGDREAALASLEQLGADAFVAHSQGEVSEEELVELAGLLEQARVQVDDELPPSTTEAPTTTTTAPVTTAPAAVTDVTDIDDDRDDDGKKGKKDEGEGRDGDDGGDDD